MKKYFFIIIGFLTIFSMAYAETITLNNSETFPAKTAASIQFRKITIDGTSKIMRVEYSWRNASGQNISPEAGGYIMTWTCADSADNPDTPEDETDTCFSDTFGFTIRSQDVGQRLGLGLRTLIWNKMKADILTPGNDGTFSGGID